MARWYWGCTGLQTTDINYSLYTRGIHVSLLEFIQFPDASIFHSFFRIADVYGQFRVIGVNSRYLYYLTNGKRRCIQRLAIWIGNHHYIILRRQVYLRTALNVSTYIGYYLVWNLLTLLVLLFYFYISNQLPFRVMFLFYSELCFSSSLDLKSIFGLDINSASFAG